MLKIPGEPIPIERMYFDIVTHVPEYGVVVGSSRLVNKKLGWNNADIFIFYASPDGQFVLPRQGPYVKRMDGRMVSVGGLGEAHEWVVSYVKRGELPPLTDDVTWHAGTL